jgi:hypothetical protein
VDIRYISEMISEKLIFGHLSINVYLADIWFPGMVSVILNYEATAKYRDCIELSRATVNPTRSITSFTIPVQ